jgi:hypothetical protein
MAVDTTGHNSVGFSPIQLQFYLEGADLIGAFEYNVQNGEWIFNGKAAESAKIFAHFLCDHFKKLIWEQEEELIFGEANV